MLNRKIVSQIKIDQLESFSEFYLSKAATNICFVFGSKSFMLLNYFTRMSVFRSKDQLVTYSSFMT